MQNRIRIWALVTVSLGSALAICTPHVRAQEWKTVVVRPEKEAEFQEALQNYKLEYYERALEQFESLANSSELHQRVTGSLLMTGKCLIKLDRFADALPYFSKLTTSFPKSQYVDDALYAKATCNYFLNEYFKATQNLMWVVDSGSNDTVVSKSVGLANRLMRTYLSTSDLRNLMKFVSGESSSALVTLQLAQKNLSEGSTEEAINLLRNYKASFTSSKYSAKIDRLLREAQTYGARAVKVGVLLPLTGYFSEEGLAVLQGIRFAQMQAQNNSGREIELVVRDSESSMVKALREATRLIKGDKVQAIIGELQSEITAGIGAFASESHIPVIGPTASENEVAAVGEAVYQLNSDLQRKGEALAQYATTVLGLQTFATLAPADDDYGRQLTDSFTAKIDQLGGRIIAQHWYYGEPQDLSRQFKTIREAAFDYDSTDVEKLIEEAKQNDEKLKEKDIPVLSIDAMFFPVYSEHIKYVTAQFAFSNIRTQILGGEYWDDLEILTEKQVQPHVNGAIFVSDYFPNEEDREFRNFRDQFRLKMKKTPERWEVFGYDAFSVLHKVINAGAQNPQQINRKLSQLSEFDGIKGKVTFKGNHRVNREVNFLQFLNGRIIKHQLNEVLNGR